MPCAFNGTLCLVFNSEINVNLFYPDYYKINYEIDSLVYSEYIISRYMSTFPYTLFEIYSINLMILFSF